MMMRWTSVLVAMALAGTMLLGCGKKTPSGKKPPVACRADSECSNNNPCDGAERCVANACVAGTAHECPASPSPCFTNGCIDVLGRAVCVLEQTGEVGCEYCALPSECDDTNPCTDDDCNADGLCVFVADDANPCSDGLSCTTGDACNAGTCAGTPVHTACNDSNLCTDDTCDPVTGDATTGCAYADNTEPCNDGFSCTTGDVCGGGSCAGTPVHSACNDTNPCTDDTCDPLTGDATTGCAYADNSEQCNDGFSCTTGDTCAGGACGGTPVHTACNDSNLCTDDACDPAIGDPTTGCAFTDNTEPCSDGFSCTTGDVCGSGACGGTPVDTACDDGDQCTTNLCDVVNGDPVTGCYFPGHTGGCDDGDVCTGGDVCSAGGTCAGTLAAMHLKACAGGVLCYAGVCLQQARTDVTAPPAVTNPAAAAQTCTCRWKAADLYYGAPPSPSTANGFWALVNLQQCTGCEHPSFPGIALSDMFGVYQVTGPAALGALDGVNLGRGYQIDAGRVVSAGWNAAGGAVDLGVTGMLRCLNQTGTAWRATTCPEGTPTTIGAMTGVGVSGSQVWVVGHDNGSATNAHLRHWGGASWTGDRWVEATNCNGNYSIVRSDANRSPTGMALVGGGTMPQAHVAAQNLAPTGTAFSSRHHNLADACSGAEYTLYRGDVDDTYFDGVIARNNTEVYLWGGLDDRDDVIVRSLWRCTTAAAGGTSWSCAEAPVPLPTRNQDRIDYWDAALTPGGDLLLAATLCVNCNPPPCTNPPCLVPTTSTSNRLIAIAAGKDGSDAASWEVHTLSGGFAPTCPLPPCISRLVRTVAADATQIYLVGDSSSGHVPTIWHLDPP